MPKDLVPRRFVNLPGSPANPEPGWTYFDTLVNKVKVWDGTVWREVYAVASAGQSFASLIKWGINKWPGRTG